MKEDKFSKSLEAALNESVRLFVVEPIEKIKGQVRTREDRQRSLSYLINTVFLSTMLVGVPFAFYSEMNSIFKKTEEPRKEINHSYNSPVK